MAAIPSLAMIPSGYKAGTLYSPVPNTATGDFSVSRSSMATRVNEEGLIESVGNNIPRLDYSDGGCPSLLLEPQSTNLQIDSEDFAGGTGWAPTNISIVAGQASPSADSPLGAYDLIENTSTSTHRLRGGTFTTVAAESTMSVYVKYSTRKYVELRELISNSRVRFDLLNNVVILETNAVAKIEDAGNGFKRISMTYTCGASTRVQFSLLNDSLSNNYTGDGTSKVTIFGFQIEYSGYASSYIPTTSAIATRLGDAIGGAGDASTFNSTEGALYTEIAALGLDQTSYLSLTDGTAASKASIVINNQTIVYEYLVSSGTQATFTSTPTSILNSNKVAVTWKLNEFKMFVNGVQVGTTDVSGSVNPANSLNQIVYNFGNGALPFYGKTKSIQVFKTALTDAELTILTRVEEK